MTTLENLVERSSFKVCIVSGPGESREYEGIAEGLREEGYSVTVVESLDLREIGQFFSEVKKSKQPVEVQGRPAEILFKKIEEIKTFTKTINKEYDLVMSGYIGNEHDAFENNSNTPPLKIEGQDHCSIKEAIDVYRALRVVENVQEILDTFSLYTFFTPEGNEILKEIESYYKGLNDHLTHDFLESFSGYSNTNRENRNRIFTTRLLKQLKDNKQEMIQGINRAYSEHKDRIEGILTFPGVEYRKKPDEFKMILELATGGIERTIEILCGFDYDASFYPGSEFDYQNEAHIRLYLQLIQGAQTAEGSYN